MQREVSARSEVRPPGARALATGERQAPALLRAPRSRRIASVEPDAYGFVMWLRLVSLGLVSLAAACAVEDSPERVCDRAVNEGCLDSEEARRCADRFESIEEHATESGCKEAGDAYLACLDEALSQENACEGDSPFEACNEALASSPCSR